LTYLSLCEYRPSALTRMLLVHANTDDREMYAEYMRGRGYNVTEVSSTDAATALIASNDVLITGLLVPGEIFPIGLIEGARTGRWGKVVPVIVVTATSVIPLHHEAEAAGAFRVLLKPCYPGDLLEAIEAALHRDSTSAQYNPRA
jgi:CheY-like chemotaxis protein